jgi:hypothetical protein
MEKSYHSKRTLLCQLQNQNWLVSLFIIVKYLSLKSTYLVVIYQTNFSETLHIEFVVENQDTIFVIRQNYIIMEDFEQPMGKFGNTYGNAMVIDSNYLLEKVVNSLTRNIVSIAGGEFFTGVIREGVLRELDDLNINHYAMEINGVLKNREEYYFGTPIQMDQRMLEAQSNMRLSMSNVISETPVKNSISEAKLVEIFLKNIFITVVFLMVLLSVMLIYSLMISDVDERTYEMGMLRVLGLRTVSIAQLLIMQSLLFSLPGVFIGVTIAAIANVIIRLFVFLHSAASYSFLFTAGSAMLGV